VIGAPDPHRPRFHLMPPSGWMNDPNGVVHWRGRYHVFYQHNPLGPRWGTPSWGHAVSDDLVRWDHAPIALAPGMPPADLDGCWSGCLVDDGGTPTILYSSARDGDQVTCLATGSADLMHWTKHPDNPVMRPPHGLRGRTVDAFRDPWVWREDDAWYALVGSSIGGMGQVLLHRSEDLRTWTYLHPFVPSFDGPVCDDTGQVWECPGFFELGGEHVLVVSRFQWAAGTHAFAFVGAYRDRRFEPLRRERLDWGHRAFFGPLTTLDERGRRLMWGWLPEQRDPARAHATWAGVASLPRVLTLENGALRQRFVPELSSLRAGGVRLEPTTVRGERALGIDTATFELRCSIGRGSAPSAGIRIVHAAGQHTEILVVWATARLVVDTRWSKGVHGSEYAFDTAPLGPFDDALERVVLHIFFDRSVLEVIADERVAVTARCYPIGPFDHDVRLVADDGDAHFEGVEVWRLEGVAGTDGAEAVALAGRGA
jgi:beta-fructofuranosidase